MAADERAYAAVREAVKLGQLPPIKSCTCCECGKPATDYHHYLGYEKEHWLAVEPLCKSCHMKKPKNFPHGDGAILSLRFVCSKQDKLILTTIAKQDGDIGMSAAVRQWLRSEANKRGIEVGSQPAVSNQSDN